METVDTVTLSSISEIRGKSKRLDETRIYNFVKDSFDNSVYTMAYFGKEWKHLKTKELL